MSETSTPAGLDRETEEAGFYHEAALNGAWTGSRLAIGGLSFLFGSFVFAYFYLRSLDSAGRWMGSAWRQPSTIEGTVIMLLVITSAGVHWAALQQIKAGHKRVWQIGAVAALLLGLAAVTMTIIQLLFLPFWPGSSGYASVFVGFYPVFLVIVLCAMFWLETLIMRSRHIPDISFVEQPPTYTEAFALQRFQANLSAFSLIWNYLALIAILFWVLFYAI
jgi:heme/copper-type cytochrome/quinol oxidase subunit 3